MRRDLAQGIRWLRHHRDVRDLTIAVGAISAMDAAWFAVFVLYVVQVLHLRPGAYGVLLAIGALGGVAPMLAGAVPIAAVAVLLAWRHRGAAPAADATHTPPSG